MKLPAACALQACPGAVDHPVELRLGQAAGGRLPLRGGQQIDGRRKVRDALGAHALAASDADDIVGAHPADPERLPGGAVHLADPQADGRLGDAPDHVVDAAGAGLIGGAVRRYPSHRERRQRARLGLDDHRLAAAGRRVGRRVPAGRAAGAPVGEQRLDLGLHRARIDVADHHDHRPLGSIVGVVERPQLRRRRGLDHLRPPDRRMHDRTARELGGALRQADRLVRSGPLARLGQHHLALGVERVGRERDVAGDFAQETKAGIHRRGVGLAEIEAIDGFLLPGGCVGVGAEAQAEPLQRLHHLAVGDVGRAAEGHVLDEVREALLVLPLLQRAGLDDEPHGDRAGRQGVLLDRVAQAIGQRAERHLRVGLQVARRLRPLRDRGHARAHREDEGRDERCGQDAEHWIDGAHAAASVLSPASVTLPRERGCCNPRAW